jgi:integrase
MIDHDETLAGYLDGDEAFAPAVPRPTFGPCQVVACERWAHRADPALCEPHGRSWAQQGRPAGAALVSWCARARALDAGSWVVVLRGLADQAQLEVLYALCCAADDERRVTVKSLQAAVGVLRSQAAPSVSAVELSAVRLPRDSRRFLIFARDRVRLAIATPEAEVANDDWDLRVFGRPGGALHFGRITQVWLQQTAKSWAIERLDTVETPDSLTRLLLAVGTFSESLRRHRSDQGADPAALSRADMLAFSNDLAQLEAAGQLSRYLRRLTMSGLNQFLREARAMGLTGPGAAAAGLGDEVILRPSDQIRRVSVDEDGRALPAVVVEQLLAPDALEQLEAASGADVRAMVELQVLVGRRTGELCGLRWDCLAADEIVDQDGQMRPAPVLIHDMPKAAVRRYHLPIGHDAVEIIRAQQARVRARYPDTATTELALFPAPNRNSRGVKARNPINFRECLRSWLAALARLLDPGDEPYDRSTITPYSFRHTYAQRHADAGTPVEVLAALMGHRKLTTTQGYYRVGQERKRAAVDLLASVQVDHAGQRTRPTVERLLDAEHLRDTVGQVAVPFGTCREPSNVKAHGQGCPFRHQCFGCTHFRSDPSYLPELRTYLSRLLADRERLRAAVPELEDWARNTAIPAGEEIAAVRRIVDRCEGLLAELPPDQRAEVDEAIGVQRRARGQLDTSMPVRFLGIISQPTPTLFPNVQREQELVDDT